MIDLPDTYGVEILRAEVGSTLYGTNLVDAPGDHDEMGIFVENPESTIGLKRREHYTYRTAGEGQPSRPGDTDLTCYSLRKWVGLALSGNANVLQMLFAPEDMLIIHHELGKDLRKHADWFASKRSANAFLGHMEQERQRFTGERGRRGRIRKLGECPNCVGEGVVHYGTDTNGGAEPCPLCGGSGGQVDWKAAMHMLRLGHQGIEYLKTGRMELPISEPYVSYLRSVRSGEHSVEDVLHAASVLETEMKLLVVEEDLPDQPNFDAVQEWMIDAHLITWSDEIEKDCDHGNRCCQIHGHHVMPHAGCIMRMV